MRPDRRTVNITLIIINILMCGVAAMLLWLPSPALSERSRSDTVPKETVSDSIQDIPSGKTQSSNTQKQRKDSGGDEPSARVPGEATTTASDLHAGVSGLTTVLPKAKVSSMTGRHPFSREAQKILSGKLEENDSLRRTQILNYCEHFRAAYPSRDIDFLRQVFSDNALIIVGSTVRTGGKESSMKSPDKVKYSVRSKSEYLDRLSKVFGSSKRLDVSFSDFKIMRHPTAENIYGVTLRQKYESDRYSDDGWLFLLWDFRNPSMPVIHVRTWQPSENVADDDDVISIGDFNLE